MEYSKSSSLRIRLYLSWLILWAFFYDIAPILWNVLLPVLVIWLIADEIRILRQRREKTVGKIVAVMSSIALFVISVAGIMKMGILPLPLQLISGASAIAVIVLTAYDFHISNKISY